MTTKEMNHLDKLEAQSVRCYFASLDKARDAIRKPITQGNESK